MKNYYDKSRKTIKENVKPADLEDFLKDLQKITKKGVNLTEDSIISRVRFVSRRNPEKSFCVNFESSEGEKIPFSINASNASVFKKLFKLKSIELLNEIDKNRLVVNIDKQQKRKE